MGQDYPVAFPGTVLKKTTGRSGHVSKIRILSLIIKLLP
jgi:hypothetical protein